MSERELPSDDIVEKAMLGAIMVDWTIAEEFFEEWQLEWFYNNRPVTKAIFKLALDWEDIDIVSVSSELGSALDGIWGLTALVEMTESTNSYYWKTYSNTLKELYKKRELIKESKKLLASCYNWDSIETSVESSFTKINNVLNEGLSSSTCMEDNIKLLDEYIKENKSKSIIWWSWWNQWLDDATLGIRKGKTYRIWSPSGVWKTNLVYWVIKTLLEQWAKVLFVSLENDIETTYAKLLSSVQGVNNRDIEKGVVLPNTDWLRKYKDKFILTDQLFDLEEIKRETLRVKPDVVILDYIWLVTMNGIRDDDKIFSAYAKKVKEFIQKTKVAWIDLSNLNTDEDEEKIRRYGKFNWSAALKNNADFWLHIFHYKPFYEYKELAEWEAKVLFNGMKVVTFLITKNRMGVDNIEKEFGINFNNGINYTPIQDDKKALWKTL